MKKTRAKLQDQKVKIWSVASSEHEPLVVARKFLEQALMIELVRKSYENKAILSTERDGLYTELSVACPASVAKDFLDDLRDVEITGLTVDCPNDDVRDFMLDSNLGTYFEFVSLE